MDGVLYVAFGEKYVREAIFSANTVKATSSLPVAIFTDQKEEDYSSFDQVRIISPEHKRAKVDFLDQTPFERTLYLDSDTKVVRDLSDVFGVLDRYDLAAVQDHSRKSYRWASKIPAYDEIPYAFPEFNGGVVLYKMSERTRDFYSLWRRHFYENQHLTNGQDQASFRIALWQSDIRIHTLPFEYNVRNKRIRNRMSARGRQPNDESLLKPRIFHWHGLNKAHPFTFWRAKYRPMCY